eukprot:1141106-Pelagomonas_calceolata.AAC.2
MMRKGVGKGVQSAPTANMSLLYLEKLHFSNMQISSRPTGSRVVVYNLTTSSSKYAATLRIPGRPENLKKHLMQDVGLHLWQV